jgi:hypothetical protein
MLIGLLPVMMMKRRSHRRRALRPLMRKVQNWWNVRCPRSLLWI